MNVQGLEKVFISRFHSVEAWSVPNAVGFSASVIVNFRVSRFPGLREYGVTAKCPKAAMQGSCPNSEERAVLQFAQIQP